MALPSDDLREPDAYAPDPEDVAGALRCIDRHVHDLGDRVTVAQALGLLPDMGHDRVRGHARRATVRGGAATAETSTPTCAPLPDTGRARSHGGPGRTVTREAT